MYVMIGPKSYTFNFQKIVVRICVEKNFEIFLRDALLSHSAQDPFGNGK